MDRGESWIKRRSAGDGALARERDGLEALAATRTVLVPKVLGYGSDGSGEWLETERFLPAGPGLDYRAFGRALARLHATEAGADFGYEHDNFIGDTPQINTVCRDWWEFFAERRLGFQIKLARDNARLDQSEARRLEKTAIRASERWKDLNIQPSLLHGDLWAGNHVMRTDGTGAVIDPAVYRGHAEADLAMTLLFGGYPSAFYEGYAEVLPEERERKERFVFYNLYHVLNHLNLFGFSYHGQLLASLRSLE